MAAYFDSPGPTTAPLRQLHRAVDCGTQAGPPGAILSLLLRPLPVCSPPTGHRTPVAAACLSCVSWLASRICRHCLSMLRKQVYLLAPLLVLALSLPARPQASSPQPSPSRPSA